MKKSLIVLFLAASLTALAQQGYDPVYVEARPWAKGHRTDLPWTSFETCIVEGLHNFIPVSSDMAAVEYGSDRSKRYPATGFFYPILDGDRWWMVDPYGYRTMNIVVVGLRQGNGEQNKAAFVERFGTSSKWLEETSAMFYSYGFSGTGSWAANDDIIKHNENAEIAMTYSPILNFMSGYGRRRGGTYQLPGNIGYPNQCIFVFDPEFENYCDEMASELVKYKDDKNLVGYFSDNEMPLSLRNLEGYLTLENPNDPGRLAAEKWLKDKGLKQDQITDSERAEFAGYVSDRYYRIVSGAIKKYDPNHLYFGSRLHGGAKYCKEIVQAAGKYCDVVAINYYGHWTPSETAMQNWGEWAQKPFIITEFYTKAMDSGLGNTAGAGFTVRTQRDRGYAYQHFTMGLVKSGNCVGWHWFRYQDNDPTDKNADPSNRDSNKGLVNNDYIPYEDLVRLMKELNMNVYRLADYFDADTTEKNICDCAALIDLASAEINSE